MVLLGLTSMLKSKINRASSKAKRVWLASALGLSLAGVGTVQPSIAQQPAPTLETLYFPHSQFKIPFNVDARGTQPTQVQLWVSTDGGATWQMQGSATSSQKHFDFRAAAEGLYLFSVQTLDENGKAFPSPQPPLRIMIDTTKPQVAVRSDVNASGQVVVDVRISEEHLKTDSVKLRYRTDQETDWREMAITNIVAAGQIYEGQAVLDIKNCREVGFVVTVADEAANIGEASTQYVMPRTASAPQDMKLASQRNGANPPSPSGLVPTPGAVAWPSGPAGSQPQQMQVSKVTPPTNGVQATAGLNVTISPPTAPGGWTVSGQLASGGNGNSGLDLTPPTPSSNMLAPNSEELPAPRAIEDYSRTTQPNTAQPNAGQQYLVDKQTAPSPSPVAPMEAQQGGRATQTPGSQPLGSFDTTPDQSPVSQAFHCNSRSFSLDYALNAAAGSALADVELWGTEDGGSTWQKWGSDPDRQSPFDVQVANDGLFGFRMVIVSQNGKVSNRPKDGDSGDAWIHVDVMKPTGKITRAVYGDGHEAGMLVIDYNCSDENLHDRPITLSYSETQDGPWATIASGLKNTGIYLWKADSNLPEHIFLRMEAVDKAGNVGTDIMNLPINVQGLSPRGRIQGFRPIANP